MQFLYQKKCKKNNILLIQCIEGEQGIIMNCKIPQKMIDKPTV